MTNRKIAGRASSTAPANGSVRTVPYQNPALPVSKRVNDLLSRMTLEEKAAQMMCVWRQKSDTLLDAEGNFDFKKAKASFRRGYGIGQVGRPSDSGKGKNARETAEISNAIQKFFMENSRLGIPVIFHEECLHGHAAIDATSFSQPIGLGATFDPELVESPIHYDRARGTGPRRPPGADPGGGCGARAALGTGGRDLWGRSLPGFAHGHGGRARISGRCHVPR